MIPGALCVTRNRACLVSAVHTADLERLSFRRLENPKVSCFICVICPSFDGSVLYVLIPPSISEMVVSTNRHSKRPHESEEDEHEVEKDGATTLFVNASDRFLDTSTTLSSSSGVSCASSSSSSSGDGDEAPFKTVKVNPVCLFPAETALGKAHYMIKHDNSEVSWHDVLWF